MNTGDPYNSDDDPMDESDETDGNSAYSSHGPSGELGRLGTFWLRSLQSSDSSSLTGETPVRDFGAGAGLLTPLDPPRPPQGEHPFADPHRQAPPPPPPAPPAREPAGNLFSERYGVDMPPGPEGLPDLSRVGASRSRGSAPNDTQPPARSANDHFYYALQQRRAEDERRTGRRWPSNTLMTPGNLHEAMYFQGLAIGIGQVDPRLLARESALRYVAAARTGGDANLGPTDIYSIVYYGLGLTIRPLDCTGLPHVLAVYHRGTREIYLDWQMLVDPPTGRAVLDPGAWQRSVDSSLIARFLLAWCAAIHLTESYDLPLVLGFTPAPRSAGVQLPGGGPSVPVVPAISGDTLNRYRKAMEAVATLLAPAERLWQQVLIYNRRLRLGDPNWRAQVRAEMTRGDARYQQPSWRASHPPTPYGLPTSMYAAHDGPPDPVDQFVAALAEQNNCLPVLVEQQLDGENGRPEWSTWSTRVLHELPVLRMRQSAAARMFGMAQANGAPMWGTGGPAPAPQSGSASATLSL